MRQVRLLSAFWSCLPLFRRGVTRPGSPSAAFMPAIAAFHGRQISLPVTLVCRLQGVATVQIHNEHKVCQCVSHHDRQKEMRQLKQAA